MKLDGELVVGTLFGIIDNKPEIPAAESLRNGLVRG